VAIESLGYDPDEGEERVRYRYGCPLVDHEGRCSCYESRPFACSDYEPGSDALCSYHGLVNVDFFGTKDWEIIEIEDAAYWESES
jgi:Fe-S-cluster containining protein